jgi:hypothetical protein
MPQLLCVANARRARRWQRDRERADLLLMEEDIEGGQSAHDAASRTLLADALHTGELGRYGEVDALRTLGEFLNQQRPGVFRDRGMYTPAEVRALAQARAAWEAEQGGPEAAIDVVAGRYVMSRPLVAAGMSRLHDALQAALRNKAALVILRSAIESALHGLLELWSREPDQGVSAE